LVLSDFVINGNNLHQDLFFLKEAVNLEELYLSNNKLYGSLKYLKKMKKLKKLDIGDTDIDSGLEHLPDSIEYFNCSVDKRKDAKCKTIYELLESLKGKSFSQKLYRTHPNATLTSKMIDTNEITKRLNYLNLSEKINIQSKEVFFKDSEEITPIEIKEKN
jgi:hypothetical protein